MHKSTITFVPLSSIVMLVATPIVNMNNVFNVKAQGYDDYSYNDSYSTYSTDDKKYECRTGPFEGFFVSSIEFCKLNSTIERIMVEIIKLVQQVQQVQQELMEHKVQQELMEHKVRQEMMEHKVQQVQQELMEHKVRQEMMEHKVLKVYKVK